MALDFSGIVKKRVPFVPYVQHEENNDKSGRNTNAGVGQTAQLPLSVMSSTLGAGQPGRAWTRVSLEDMRVASHCYNSDITISGHTGHVGQAITQDDIEYFDERAGVAEFEGRLGRLDAEAQAFGEWQAWRSKRVLH